MDCVICKCETQLVRVMNYASATQTLLIRDYIFELLDPGGTQNLELNHSHYICVSCMDLINNLLYLKRHIVDIIKRAEDDVVGDFNLAFENIFSTFKANINEITYEENHVAVRRAPTPLKKYDEKLPSTPRSIAGSDASDENGMLQEIFSEPYKPLTEREEVRELRKYSRGRPSPIDREIMKLFKRRKRRGHNWTRRSGRQSRSSLRPYSRSSYKSRTHSRASITSAYSCQTSFSYDENPSTPKPQVFTCKIDDCYLNFMSLFELTEHKKEDHQLLDKFWCEECHDTKFTTREDLNFHCIQDHDKLLSNCLYCLKEFKTATSYYQHLRDHKLRSFPCSYCDKIFADRTSCLAHVKADHKGKREVAVEKKKTKVIKKRYKKTPSPVENNKKSGNFVVKILLQPGGEGRNIIEDALEEFDCGSEVLVDDAETEEAIEESVIYGPQPDDISEASAEENREENVVKFAEIKALLDELIDKVFSSIEENNEPNSDVEQNMQNEEAIAVEELNNTETVVEAVPEPLHYEEIIESDRVPTPQIEEVCEAVVEENCDIPELGLPEKVEGDTEISSKEPPRTSTPIIENGIEDVSADFIENVAEEIVKETEKPQLEKVVPTTVPTLSPRKERRRACKYSDFSRFTEGINFKSRSKTGGSSMSKLMEKNQNQEAVKEQVVEEKEQKKDGEKDDVVEETHSTISTNITENDYESLIQKLTLEKNLRDEKIENTNADDKPTSSVEKSKKVKGVKKVKDRQDESNKDLESTSEDPILSTIEKEESVTSNNGQTKLESSEEIASDKAKESKSIPDKEVLKREFLKSRLSKRQKFKNSLKKFNSNKDLETEDSSQSSQEPFSISSRVPVPEVEEVPKSVSEDTSRNIVEEVPNANGVLKHPIAKATKKRSLRNKDVKSLENKELEIQYPNVQSSENILKITEAMLESLVPQEDFATFEGPSEKGEPLEKNEASVEKTEASVEKNEASVEKNEASIEKNEASGEENEPSVEKLSEKNEASEHSEASEKIEPSEKGEPSSVVPTSESETKIPENPDNMITRLKNILQNKIAENTIDTEEAKVEEVSPLEKLKTTNSRRGRLKRKRPVRRKKQTKIVEEYHHIDSQEEPDDSLMSDTECDNTKRRKENVEEAPLLEVIASTETIPNSEAPILEPLDQNELNLTKPKKSVSFSEPISVETVFEPVEYVEPEEVASEVVIDDAVEEDLEKRVPRKRKRKKRTPQRRRSFKPEETPQEPSLPLESAETNLQSSPVDSVKPNAENIVRSSLKESEPRVLLVRLPKEAFLKYQQYSQSIGNAPEKRTIRGKGRPNDT